jgi:hypothetical protein
MEWSIMRQRRRSGIRLLAIGCAVLSAVSCVSLDPGSFMPEQGYLYGVGEGRSTKEAEEAARRDLLSNGLTASREKTGARGAPVQVTPEAARAFPFPKLRAWAEKKTDASASVAFRMKTKDWDTLEKKWESAVGSEIAPQLLALKSDAGPAVAARVLKAGQLLQRLQEEGLTDILTVAGPGTMTVSQSLAAFCREQADGLLFTVTPADGFIASDTAFTVAAVTREGGSPGPLPLRVTWSAKNVEPRQVLATTDQQGTLRLDFPSAAAFRNRAVRLSVSTDFTAAGAAREAVYSYHHFDDVRGYFSAVTRVPGGAFTAGALARDRRATKKEAPRAAQTGAFLVDRTPVTNAQYAVFLADTRSESQPEYWDNPDYNQDDQPVVGVSWEDANLYAAWLSERLGVTRRLPTEDEWEKAARAGQEVIYPWGDQAPAGRANYSGNGRFRGLSPVGSFASGGNAYGLLDMAGNVWQWTSTAFELPAGTDAPAVIVKGGSWMDGPGDLRISNRRDVDPAKGYVDVGFRLVTEVSDE